MGDVEEVPRARNTRLDALGDAQNAGEGEFIGPSRTLAGQGGTLKWPERNSDQEFDTSQRRTLCAPTNDVAVALAKIILSYKDRPARQLERL